MTLSERYQLEAYRRERHFRKLTRQVVNAMLFVLFLWLSYQCALEVMK